MSEVREHGAAHLRGYAAVSPDEGREVTDYELVRAMRPTTLAENVRETAWKKARRRLKKLLPGRRIEVKTKETRDAEATDEG